MVASYNSLEFLSLAVHEERRNSRESYDATNFMRSIRELEHTRGRVCSADITGEQPVGDLTRFYSELARSLVDASKI